MHDDAAARIAAGGVRIDGGNAVPAAEGEVERTVGVVADDGRIGERGAGASKAGQEDLAVGLQRDVVRDIGEARRRRYARRHDTGAGRGRRAVRVDPVRVRGRQAAGIGRRDADVHVGGSGGSRAAQRSCRGVEREPARQSAAVALAGAIRQRIAIGVREAIGRHRVRERGAFRCDEALLGAERRVERAVGVVARERKVKIARRRESVTADDDLTVGLHADRECSVWARSRTDARHDDAVAASERRVERAVRVVADDREVRAAGVRGSRDEQLAVRLLRDARAGRRAGADRRCDNAVAAAEARIERAVGVVTREREDRVGDEGRDSGDDDTAIGLLQDAASLVDGRADGRRHDAVAAAERGVERAGRRVTDKREVVARRGEKDRTGNEDAAVRLREHSPCRIRPCRG